MKQFSIADFNTRINLKAPTRTPDGAGGWSTVYKTMVTTSAKKTTHRSDEAVQAMATTGITIHNFRIWWRKDVKKSWLLEENGKSMNIIGLIMVREGLMRLLDITAKEAA